MILAALYALFVVGVVLFFIGRRGKRIDNHSLCANCGFDLSGIPRDSWRCAECGSDVRLPGAIRIGHRQKRHWLIATGFSAAILFGAFAGTLTYAAFAGLNYLHYMPAWVCVRQARNGNPAEQATAFAELDARVAGSSASAVAASALDLQADEAVRWDYRWGDLVERAHRLGTLRPELWERYLRQIIIVHEKVRPRIALSEGVFMMLELESRSGGTPAASLPRFIVDTEVHIQADGRSASRAGPRPQIYSPGLFSEHPIRFVPGWTAVIGPGVKQVSLEHRWIVHELAIGGISVNGKATRNFELFILPPGVPSVASRADPALDRSVAEAITVQRVGMANGEYDLEIHGGHAPIDLAFNVFMKFGEAEIKLGDLIIPRNRDYLHVMPGKIPGTQDVPPPKEIILRSSESVAANTTDLFEIYRGELRLKVEQRQFQSFGGEVGIFRSSP